jgi:hypothetical protein
MTGAYPARSTRDVSRDHEGATPAFAIMALLTGLGGSPMDRLRSSGQGRRSAEWSPRTCSWARSLRRLRPPFTDQLVGDHRCFH